MRASVEYVPPLLIADAAYDELAYIEATLGDKTAKVQLIGMISDEQIRQTTVLINTLFRKLSDESSS